MRERNTPENLETWRCFHRDGEPTSSTLLTTCPREVNDFVLELRPASLCRIVEEFFRHTDLSNGNDYRNEKGNKNPHGRLGRGEGGKGDPSSVSKRTQQEALCELVLPFCGIAV